MEMAGLFGVRDRRRLPEIFLIASVLIWGFSFISIKVCTEVIPIAFLSFIRFLIAAAVLLVMCFITKNKERPKKKHLLKLAVSGILGITLYYYFEGLGIKNISASSVSIINATIPLFTLLAEVIFYKKKLKASYIIGLIVSLAGICFTVDIRTVFLSKPGYMLGYMFIILSVLCWVAYTLITRKLFLYYSDMTITTYQTLFGTLAFLPFLFTEKVKPEYFTRGVIYNIIFLGVFSSALAYYFYASAIRKVGMVKSSMALNVVPVITILGSAFILKEAITIQMAAGCILIFLSLKLAKVLEQD